MSVRFGQRFCELCDIESIEYSAVCKLIHQTVMTLFLVKLSAKLSIIDYAFRNPYFHHYDLVVENTG